MKKKVLFSKMTFKNWKIPVNRRFIVCELFETAKKRLKKLSFMTWITLS